MRTSLALSFLLLPFAVAAQGRPPAAVAVAKAELKSMAPSVTAVGQVQSRAGADISAGIAGRLEFVVEPGARVKQGAVLARVDTGELALARAEQAARVTRGEVALKQAQREVERLRASGNAVSRYQLEQSEAARDLAQSDLEIARAALRQTGERLGRAEVRAPFAGVVSQRMKREGEEVQRGEAIARLHDTEHLEVRLFLPLRHVRAIAPGSEVTVTAEELTTNARVRSIVPVGDARSQSVEALIDLPDAAERMLVGTTVRVEVPLSAPQQALAVPRDALVIRAEGVAVYRVHEGKTAQRVPVKLGIADGPWVSVEGALDADDAVVIRGAESLHDGDAVKVIPFREV